MFSKLSFFVFIAPLVSALTLQAPSSPTSGGSVTINWTTASGDPSTFSLELTNPIFNNAIAIANNVDASLNSITLTLPIVNPGGSYTVQAVDIGNINQVFAETPIFSVAPTVSSSVSATAPISLSSGTASATANSLPVTTGASTTSSPSTVTGLTAVTGTSTGTSSAAASTTSTAGAVSRFALTNAGGYAALMLAAVAGAAAVAF